MKAHHSTLNIISTLPQTIIETILCLLRIEEAARTSILSREWRYKWTTIPKLEFHSYPLPKRTIEENQPSDIISARKNMDHRCKLFYAIHQVLLLRQGPIHEFILSMDGANGHCFEIDQILLHLARNHQVEKLKLHLSFSFGNIYKLPLCAFSFHQLTDLHLCYIDFNYPPMFSGFGSLRNLCLSVVNMSSKDLLLLLSNCPSLKRFNLFAQPLGPGFKDCTIVELFKCLPVIEHLTIFGYDLWWFVLGSVPEEFPTTLIHLKYFRCQDMCFDDDQKFLTFLAVLIKCSPNLEKIVLAIDETQCRSFSEIDEMNKAEGWTCSESDESEEGETCSDIGEPEKSEKCPEIDETEEDETCSYILKKISDVWLEHLDELEIRDFNNWKSEMEFVKFILARSPKLKKVRLSVSRFVGKDEMLEMLKILLQAPRASPVEIIVESLGRGQ